MRERVRIGCGTGVCDGVDSGVEFGVSLANDGVDPAAAGVEGVEDDTEANAACRISERVGI